MEDHLGNRDSICSTGSPAHTTHAYYGLLLGAHKAAEGAKPTWKWGGSKTVLGLIGHTRNLGFIS